MDAKEVGKESLSVRQLQLKPLQLKRLHTPSLAAGKAS
ncbi:MAG: hypothetical protein BWY14_00840 [Parcubacteria group bacterium ADurb.Bin192]|nr:MAG: hypothetical protein BWY14_00840 [Parcubacteria group bacterium ADurb.Bin192]